MTTSKYIAILTSNPCEFDAVLAHFPHKSRHKLAVETKVLEDFQTRMATMNGYSVIITCSRCSGPKIIQGLIALGQYKPCLVLFSGFAGAARADIKLGTVILGNLIADLSIATEDPNGIRYTVRDLSIDDELKALCKVVVENENWLARIVEPAIAPLETITRLAKLGTIGSSSVLVRNADGPFSRDLIQAHPDACAIEMESAFCHAVCQITETPFTAVRGISDLLSDKSPLTDPYRQPWAAAHASAATVELVSKYIQTKEERTEMNDSDSDETKADKTIENQSLRSDFGPQNGSSPFSMPETFETVLKRPARYRGESFRIQISLEKEYDTASQDTCTALGLEFGNAIQRKMILEKPILAATDQRQLELSPTTIRIAPFLG